MLGAAQDSVENANLSDGDRPSRFLSVDDYVVECRQPQQAPEPRLQLVAEPDADPFAGRGFEDDSDAASLPICVKTSRISASLRSTESRPS
jgi:hypothetical protein